MLLAFCLPATAVAWEARPNFLFILVDDQSPFDLKIYNPKSKLDTPNIDKLADRGMVFDGAYHMGSFSGAVCMPSRHMIMSGRTVWHLPPSPDGATKSPPHLEQQTIPAVFNRAGYATMRTCKQGNSYEAANKLFTVRQDATKRGDTDETGSAWHTNRVLDYLDKRESSKDAKPFLIYFGFSHPHDERDGKPELLAKYGANNHTDPNSPPSILAQSPQLPENYLLKHPFDNSHADVRDEIAVSGVWKRRDEATVRNEIGREFACSENIDIQIGRVLKKLEASGELENTFVIYTADHGMSIGRHGLMGKQNLYQHTWRVPFVVAGPGVKTGTRVEGNIYLLDVLATLCDLARIPPPESNEGTSFKRVLEGNTQAVRDVLYGVYCGGSKPGMRCVKQGDWKLIQYEAPDRSVVETQLFNLKANPDELLVEHGSVNPMHKNLATDPEYSAQLSKMQTLLLAEMRRLDDPFRFTNQPSDNLPEITNAARKAKNKNK